MDFAICVSTDELLIREFGGKKMAVIIVLIMVAIALIADFLLKKNYQEVKATEVEPTFSDIEGVKLLEDASYHPLHTWAKKIDARTAVVGLDDFGRRLIGDPDKVTLPVEGMTLENGQSCIRIKKGNKAVSLISPMSGEVIETNPNIINNPIGLCIQAVPPESERRPNTGREANTAQSIP